MPPCIPPRFDHSTPFAPAPPSAMGDSFMTDFSIFPAMEIREGDIVIDGAQKTGTSWISYVAQQLVSNGDDSFKYLYDTVPLLEAIQYPNQPLEERLKKLADMPRDVRRVFKSHQAIPFSLANPKVKYLVPVRNPLDCLVSFYHFIHGYSNDFFKVFGELPINMSLEQFVDFSLQRDNFWYMVNTWWPLRNHPNVMLVHYADMKTNPSETIDKIAEFLGVNMSPELKSTVLHRTSFAYMKANEGRMEGFFFGKNRDIPALTFGNYIREGKIGARQELPPALSAKYEQRCKQLCLSQEQLAWCENGGSLPK